jgi:uncharacterized DUF497 family protein
VQGIFAGAVLFFLQPPVLISGEDPRGGGEATTAQDRGCGVGVLLLVAHTYQTTGPASASVRLISARPATKRERLFYENEPR